MLLNESCSAALNWFRFLEIRAAPFATAAVRNTGSNYTASLEKHLCKKSENFCDKGKDFNDKLEGFCKKLERFCDKLQGFYNKLEFSVTNSRGFQKNSRVSVTKLIPVTKSSAPMTNSRVFVKKLEDSSDKLEDFTAT